METQTAVEPPKRKRYVSTNAQWPSDIPPLSRLEAERAIKRLYKKFGDGHKPRYDHSRPMTRIRIRRCWITVSPPFNWLDRGWRRLVHDASHRIARRLYPGKRPHDWRHEHLERDMTAYVIAQGWLDGKLKPPPKPKLHPVTLRHKRVVAGIARWEAKEKRARNALKKLRRQKAYYERKVLGAAL